MNHVLPLPKEIPLPRTSTCRAAMAADGIIFGESTAATGYVSYTLPDKWTMVDHSLRKDLPEWYIIDADDMMRYSIRGCWKGTYDNELEIRRVAEPTKFQPRQKQANPSETTLPAMDRTLWLSAPDS